MTTTTTNNTTQFLYNTYDDCGCDTITISRKIAEEYNRRAIERGTVDSLYDLTTTAEYFDVTSATDPIHIEMFNDPNWHNHYYTNQIDSACVNSVYYPEYIDYKCSDRFRTPYINIYHYRDDKTREIICDPTLLPYEKIAQLIELYSEPDAHPHASVSFPYYYSLT